ncbi:mutator protein MutT [Melghirimyces profundicolus]|uniref:Mutator protein MutT n=1 Tax=Melghirimyces profundicolus TaxID=1242148 RepID=A0A2T6C7N1_9BACL|nr:NUDIX domain-containing protein [Melghirimyces profundicolus]PTX64315.1 mutator protein MutT [Melghirimyces profundicolus]
MGDYRLPISVKGVLLDASDRICLLKNERNQWELPGGRLERGESPEQALVREIREELGIQVLISHLLDTWIFEVLPGKEVLIVTYRCYWDGEGQIERSEEHEALEWFSLDDLKGIEFPDGYQKAVQKSLDR